MESKRKEQQELQSTCAGRTFGQQRMTYLVPNKVKHINLRDALQSVSNFFGCKTSVSIYVKISEQVSQSVTVPHCGNVPTSFPDLHTKLVFKLEVMSNTLRLILSLQWSVWIWFMLINPSEHPSTH
jgi:hypothetical protein